MKKKSGSIIGGQKIPANGRDEPRIAKEKHLGTTPLIEAQKSRIYQSPQITLKQAGG